VCGFVGLIGNEHARERIEPMLEALRSRGPDEVGYSHAAGYSLGFCRLSVVALDTGHQPVSSRTGRIGLVFNGEIYNYLHLRERLHSEYGVWAASEAEALVCAYEREGPAFVSELDGDFAIAIVDTERRRCFLYRDPCGVKPLYYARIGNGIWSFSSHPCAFFQHPEFATDLDVIALTEQRVLSFWSTHRTCFDNIHQLPPGHSLSFVSSESTTTCGEPTLTRFDRGAPEPVPVDERSSIDAIIVRCAQVLSESTRKRVVHADVAPVVLALSGGVDSSLLATLAASDGDGRVTALTIYDDDVCDDRRYAAAVAQRLGLTHHDRRVTFAEFLEAFPRLVLALSAPKPTYTPYYLGLGVRECYPSAKVLLCGEGADELFLGYSLLQNYHGYVSRAIGALRQEPAWLIEASDLLRRVRRWEHARDEEIRSDLIDMFQADQLVSSHLLPFDHGPMAHGIECRVPFLGSEVREFVRSVPQNMLEFNRQPKLILRSLLAAALDQQSPFARELLTRDPSPAFFAVANCRESLQRLLQGALGRSKLARSDLAGFARDAEGLFWIASIRAVFLEHRCRIDGLTFQALCNEVLGDALATERVEEVLE